MKGQSYDPLKRCLDIVASAAGLVIASPLLAGVAIGVAAKLGRPVIFAQERPGLGGKIFRMYKFRSMLPPDPSRGVVADADRLTPFGAALRASSLDELPSLWNVLKGEMSFVGPRPLLVEYLDRYTPEQARRHEVRPGITGLAQARGRNAMTWEDRFALDVIYTKQRCLALDARILMETAASVILRRGISAEGHVTMRKYGDVDEGRAR